MIAALHATLEARFVEVRFFDFVFCFRDKT